MFKKSIFVFLSVICIFISVICAYAQDSDSYTIVTYYPSPYGVYREMRAQRMAIGEDYIQGGQYCWPPETCTNQIYTDLNGNGSYDSFPIDEDLVDLVVQGSVGIGTAEVLANHGRVQIASINVPLGFRETDETGRGSLWRMPLDNKHLRFDVSLNGIDFGEPETGFIVPLDLYPNGNVVLSEMGGNVGIGTPDPQGKLEVNVEGGSDYDNDRHDVKIGPYLSLGTTRYYTSSYIGFNAYLNSSSGVSGYNRFKPHYASGNGLIMKEEQGASGNLDFYGIDWNGDSSEKNFPSAFTHIMRIGYNGNVGIGTTNPEATLEVKGTMKVFGAWESKSQDTVYQAATDGFVIANVICPDFDRTYRLDGYTDSNNPPTTRRVSATGSKVNGLEYEQDQSFTMPVRKGDYWRVTGTSLYGSASYTITIYWMSLGT